VSGEAVREIETMDDAFIDSPLGRGNEGLLDIYKSPPPSSQSINQVQINFMFGETKLGSSKIFDK
jgi:hypothetical protein